MLLLLLVCPTFPWKRERTMGGEEEEGGENSHGGEPPFLLPHEVGHALAQL